MVFRDVLAVSLLLLAFGAFIAGILGFASKGDVSGTYFLGLGTVALRAAMQIARSTAS